uniref:Uncharacterized protein n=1 Tax=Lepeophtheirus salmonis TaxID=72036 RepID=A0A0K2TRA2_LEPSM
MKEAAVFAHSTEPTGFKELAGSVGVGLGNAIAAIGKRRMLKLAITPVTTTSDVELANPLHSQLQLRLVPINLLLSSLVYCLFLIERKIRSTNKTLITTSCN